MKTTSAKADTVAAEQLAGIFESDFTATDRARAEALEELQQIRAAKANHLQRQRVRLVSRLGEEHPRVLELNALIASNQQLTRGLKLEVDRAQTETVEADAETWILHGYVRNQDGQGQPNLTIAIYDHAGQWVRGLGYTCTDGSGYFKLRYHRSSESRIEAMAAHVRSELFIRVSDPKKNVVSTDRTPVKVELGQVEYREIIIEGADASCSPPSDTKSRSDSTPSSAAGPSRKTSPRKRRKSRRRSKPS